MKISKYLHNRKFKNSARTDFSSEIISRFHDADISMENIYGDYKNDQINQ